jgi:hypothetical protein
VCTCSPNGSGAALIAEDYKFETANKMCFFCNTDGMKPSGTLLSLLWDVYTYTPKMEAIGSFEIPVKSYQTTRRHVPEDGTDRTPDPNSDVIATVVGSDQPLTVTS